jgi:hypothetical protein
MAAIGAGADMAAAALLETLSPESIEAEASERGFTLRGRAATCWEILNRRHARLASDDAGNPVRQAFVEAYGRSASAS